MKIKHMHIVYDDSYGKGSQAFKYEYNLDPGMVCRIHVPAGGVINCVAHKSQKPFPCVLAHTCSCVLSVPSDKVGFQCSYYNPPCANKYPYVLFKSASDVLEEL